MAKVLGETARYVTKQSIKKYQREFIAINLASFFLALIIGLWLGLSLNKQAYLWIIISIFIVALILFLTTQLTNRVTNKLEKKRIDFRKGATGEALVGFILEGFPDAYTVIHGLKPKRHSGDIDHIVVGPTGVYAIDTKNWKGIVTADGHGELLLNGRPTQKAAIGDLTRTIMTIKKKIKVLSALDPYVRGVLAFPSARVEAKWRTTGSVHCMGDDQLYKYIVENKKRGKLTKKEIDSISQAFLAVARKDKDFVPDGK
jgi:hypothetical protein